MNGMDTQSRALLGVAALSGFIAVCAGAFGAHGAAEPQAKVLLETGAHYQTFSALAAMACAILERHGLRRAVLAGWMFVAGGLLFALSLYFIAIGQPRAIGAVTPIGGLLMLAGWASLALSALGVVRPDKDDASPAL